MLKNRQEGASEPTISFSASSVSFTQSDSGVFTRWRQSLPSQKDKPASWTRPAPIGLAQDSDLAFLHYQERKLRAKAAGPDGWSSAYYMPGDVRGFHTWGVRANI